MAKGLGNTIEEEHLPGLHLLSQVRLHLQSAHSDIDYYDSISKAKSACFSPTPLQTK